MSTQELFWIKRAQRQGASDIHFLDDKEQLSLELKADGVWKCRRRIQGEYPIYLPDSALYTAKVVQHAHGTTLHGGVGLTMTKVREKLWVPRRRKLVKRTLKKCWGCKRFRAVPVHSPPQAPLAREGTEGDTHFSVIGVDFAGPVKYLQKPKREQKAYVVLLLLQPNPWSIPGTVTELGDRGVYQEPETTDSEKRKAIKSIFRQWKNLCSGSQVVEQGAQG